MVLPWCRPPATMARVRHAPPPLCLVTCCRLSHPNPHMIWTQHLPSEAAPSEAGSLQPLTCLLSSLLHMHVPCHMYRVHCMCCLYCCPYPPVIHLLPVLPVVQVHTLGSEAIVVRASVGKRDDVEAMFKEVGASHVVWCHWTHSTAQRIEPDCTASHHVTLHHYMLCCM